MTGAAATMLSILMLAAFALAGGGLFLIVQGRDARKGALMLVCSFVLVANVFIWSV